MARAPKMHINLVSDTDARTSLVSAVVFIVSNLSASTRHASHGLILWRGKQTSDLLSVVDSESSQKSSIMKYVPEIWCR